MRVVLGRVLRTAVVLASVSVLVVTGYGWTALRTAAAGIVTTDALDPAPARGLDEAFTALLVGIDSRSDANGNPLPPEVLAQLRAGEDEGQFNTDTIILLHVPAGPDPRATAVSIPRDSYVPLAGTGRLHKVNSAYRRGMADVPGTERDRREAGRQALVRTVEQLTGARIDHFAEINLAGFVEITEVIGGVPVCLNAPVREERAGIDLPAGYQTVAGADALAFVRQRHDLPNGDLDRVTRQQAFLAGVVRTAVNGALADPTAVDRLVRAVSRYVVLDRGWNLDLLLDQLRRASGRDISFRTIPTGRPDLVTPNDGVAVEVDPTDVRAFVQAVISGTDQPVTGSAAPTVAAAPTTVRTVPAPLGPVAAAPATGSPTTGSPAPGMTAATVPCVD